MSKKTDAELLAEADALDTAYAAAAAFDAAHAEPDDGEEHEDEMELLRKAGLSRGTP